MFLISSVTALLLLLCNTQQAESFSLVANKNTILSNNNNIINDRFLGANNNRRTNSVLNGKFEDKFDDVEDEEDEEAKEVEVVSDREELNEKKEPFPADESAPLLVVKNLGATINDKTILKNLNLVVNKGEIHAIMGTNGSGKSTFSKVLVGHPAYEVSGGEILYKGSSLLECDPEERSHLGLFLAFQYPIELPGVSNEAFLRLAYNSKQNYYNKPDADPIEFLGIANEMLKKVNMDPAFLSRNVNEGFSGGEKKRNEILQMILLDSQLSILDETDSGLDIDALKTISQGINNFMGPTKSIILITHYQRLLDYVNPDFVHVMQDGEIVKTGGPDLAKELEAKGYEWLQEPADKKEEKTVSGETARKMRAHTGLKDALKKSTRKA